MENILAETIRLLEEGQSLIWATVIRNTGSTPRRAGSRMLVDRQGGVLGSVGGGRLEAETLALARRLLDQGGGRELLEFDLTSSDASQTDMICGGQASVYVESLGPGDLELVRGLAGLLAQKERPLWLTWISEAAASFQQSHLLACRGERLAGGLALGQGAELPGEATPQGKDPVLLALPDGQGLLFCELLGPSSRLYIFGGGHVALELAWLADRLDFEVVVMDDRAEFANRERFPMAAEVRVCAYEKALEGVELGPDTYLVIVTRGHLHDLEVLEQALAGEPAYLGMIGSRRKRDLIFRELLSRGASRERLDAVHAPIGIKMPAETPAEIAVSIAAELITVRAEQAQGRGDQAGGKKGRACLGSLDRGPLPLQGGKGGCR